MIATELALELGGDLGYDSVDEITADIAAKVAGFANVTADSRLRGDGVLAERAHAASTP